MPGGLGYGGIGPPPLWPRLNGALRAVAWPLVRYPKSVIRYSMGYSEIGWRTIRDGIADNCACGNAGTSKTRRIQRGDVVRRQGEVRSLGETFYLRDASGASNRRRDTLARH